jgi:hypothetical protein
VARIYAGILGLVALLASVALGVFRGEATNTILVSAWLSLLEFSAVGYVVGSIAGSVVRESVQRSISAELAAEQASEGSPAVPTA